MGGIVENIFGGIADITEDPALPQGFMFNPDFFDVPRQQFFDQEFNQALRDAQTRGLPGSGLGPQTQARGQQQELAQLLFGEARGEGPTIAESLFREGQERNLAQTLGALSAQSQPNTGMTQRVLADQLARGSQRAGSEAARIRTGEIQQSRANLGNLLSGMRGQDLGALQTSIQGQALNDALRMGALRGAFGVSRAQQDANIQKVMTDIDRQMSIPSKRSPLRGIGGIVGGGADLLGSILGAGAMGAFGGFGGAGAAGGGLPSYLQTAPTMV